MQTSIDFATILPANVPKMNVLSMKPRNLIEDFNKYVFCSKSLTFSENPCARAQKAQKNKKNKSVYVLMFSNGNVEHAVLFQCF